MDDTDKTLIRPYWTPSLLTLTSPHCCPPPPSTLYWSSYWIPYRTPFTDLHYADLPFSGLPVLIHLSLFPLTGPSFTGLPLPPPLPVPVHWNPLLQWSPLHWSPSTGSPSLYSSSLAPLYPPPPPPFTGPFPPPFHWSPFTGKTLLLMPFHWSPFAVSFSLPPPSLVSH